ncbi:tripartite tricarboxylate transporter TctB family protein [Ureibacillus terrenus]|nr:tripartite tricarboxylate transporter TctB family protein [Ureibacillus terrenus]
MSLLVFFVLFLLAGYIVAGIVFLSMVFWKEYKWYVAVLLSAGITLIFYVLFNHLLKVHLPIGGMLF